MVVIVVHDDSDFKLKLENAGINLVVVEFTGAWCNPCLKMSPVFKQLSNKYTRAVFLKVNVDQCQETAINQDIVVLPAFGFYRDETRLTLFTGANAEALEAKIKELIGDDAV
ncbi:thioredoxin-like [Panonychus citri]|uniref:thioredoxin-like n=1 Tax=Panonychus citri TaxID=50023 RepID=UPI002307189F|nr:thioredoxin-like [Panonychus citri]